jgi:hypothetical protein
MASTYQPIATTTLGSSASSVTFSSISGSYTDLVLVVAGTYTSGGTNDAALQFNSDTGSNYSWTRLLGNGSAASSSRSTNDVQIDFGLISSTNQSNSIAHIQNYSNSTTYKTVLGRGNSTEYVGAIVGTWRNTSAITSITVKSAATYSSGTTFVLYGITAA